MKSPIAAMKSSGLSTVTRFGDHPRRQTAGPVSVHVRFGGRQHISLTPDDQHRLTQTRQPIGEPDRR